MENLISFSSDENYYTVAGYPSLVMYLFDKTNHLKNVRHKTIFKI